MKRAPLCHVRFPKCLRFALACAAATATATSISQAQPARQDQGTQTGWAIGHTAAVLSVPGLLAIGAAVEDSRQASVIGAAPMLVPAALMAPDLQYDGSMRRPWTHARYDLAIVALTGIGLAPHALGGKRATRGAHEVPLLLGASGAYLVSAGIGYWQIMANDGRQMSASAGATSGMAMMGLSLAGSAGVIADIARRGDVQWTDAVLGPLVLAPPIVAIALDEAYDAKMSGTTKGLMVGAYGGAVGYFAFSTLIWAAAGALEEPLKPRPGEPKADKRLPSWVILPTFGLLALGLGASAYEVGTLPRRAKFSGSGAVAGGASPGAAGWQLTPTPGGLSVSGWF